MDLTGGSSWLDLLQGGPSSFSFAQDAEQAVASLGVKFSQGDYHASRNPVESLTWGAENQLNGFMGSTERPDVPASAGTPPPAAWQQQLYGSNAAAEFSQAAGPGMPQYGMTQELMLFEQQQQLLMAASQPQAAFLQQGQQPRLGLNMGMPVAQQHFQQLQPQLYAQPQQQQQYQQLSQMHSQPAVLPPQQQQQQFQLPAQLQSRLGQPQLQSQQMQPQQQYLQQHQQQQYHAVTTCGPTALGIGLPAFGGSAPAEQMLQSPQQALSVPAADVCFSSVGSAAAAAAAGTAAAAGRGGGTEMRSKSRSSSGKRSAQISAVTGMPLTKSGDASRRYRERQKGLVATLEAELEGKLGQLQLLAAENEMLKLRASVLESTVASREYAVQVTREHGPPVYDSASSLAFSEDPHHEPSEGIDSGPLAQPSTQPPAAAAAAAPARRCMSLQELHDLAAPVPGVAAAAAADSGISSAHTGVGHSSSAGRAVDSDSPTERSKSCPELIKEMSVDEIAQHYRLFVRELSDELVAVQQEKANAAHAAAHNAAAAGVAAAVKPEDSGGFSSLSEQRLQQITQRCTYMFRVAATLNPAAYCHLFGRNLETGQPVAYDDAHWRRVIARLELSETQVRHVAACAELYFPAVHQLQAERAALQQQLQASGPAQGMLIDIHSEGCEFTPMQPVLDALATNLKKEHVMRVMLTGFVFGEVFSSVQKAKVTIFSAPVFPDMHAITCVMVKDALAKRAAQGLPPRFVFPHRHGPDGAKRVMEGAAAGVAVQQQQQQQQQQEVA